MDPKEMFFNGWEPLVRTLVVGVAAYLSMLVMVRVSGPRTLAQLNAFDLIVTVALGSTLASVIVSSDVALAQGLLAFFLLILMQYLLASAARRSNAWDRLITGEPQLLLHRGRVLEATMKKNRVQRAALDAAVRNSGFSTCDVLAVVLETNGKLSVIGAPTGEKCDAVPTRDEDRKG
jgi:uncharacterized membrane protein YcaP (DUF421 family)